MSITILSNKYLWEASWPFIYLCAMELVKSIASSNIIASSFKSGWSLNFGQVPLWNILSSPPFRPTHPFLHYHLRPPALPPPSPHPHLLSLFSSFLPNPWAQGKWRWFVCSLLQPVSLSAHLHQAFTDWKFQHGSFYITNLDTV